MTGRIVAATNGDPLRHAKVTIAGSGASIPAVLSDQDGRFRFASLATGRYRLSAVKAGFAKTTATIAVADRSAADAGDVALRRGGAITGTVVDSLGEPIGGIGVAIVISTEGRKDVRTVASTESDDTGAFRFSGLAAGTYTVFPLRSTGIELRLNEGDPLSAALISRLRIPQGPQITVQAGEEKNGIAVTAERVEIGGPPLPASSAPGAPAIDPKAAAMFRGRVVDPAGKPIANVQVLLLSADTGGAVRASTDADGNYEVAVANPLPERDRFRLVARRPGYAQATYGAGRSNVRGTILEAVAGAAVERLNLTMSRLGAIAGRIVDDIGEPVQGAIVHAMQVRYVEGRRRLVNASVPRRTDDLGRFRLFFLRPGTYAIAATVGQVMEGRAAEEMPGFGTTYFPGTADPSGIQFVTLPAASDAADVEFGLARTAAFRVAGHASDSAGAPATGGIALFPRQHSGAAAMTQMGARISPDGAFEFLNVTPGEYVLQVARGTGRTPSSEGEFAARFVTVVDADVTGLEVHTRAGSTIRGRVVLEDGGEVATRLITISAVPADLDRAPQIGSGTARARIEDDLTFELAQINGPRRLQVLRAPDGWMLKAIRARGSDLTDVPLEFGADDQSLDDVEVVLTNRVTQIAGSLGEVRGLSPTEISVYAFATDPELWYLNTRFMKRSQGRADGTYALEGLPAGEYFVVAAESPDDPGEWRDPEVLERLAARARRVRIDDGEKVSLALRPETR